MFTCGNRDILICKENWKSESWCWQNEEFSYFDYRGVENALVQNPIDWKGNGTFTPKLIIVIQMN